MTLTSAVRLTLLSDPDYSKKLAEARAKYLADVVEGDKLEAEFKKNAPVSMAEINAYCEENNIDAEKKNATIGKMYELVDNLTVGKMPVELFEMVANGLSHDDDVDYAREAGKAEGKQTKVTDKVRKLKKADRVAPTQSDGVGSNTELPKNMFGF